MKDKLTSITPEMVLAGINAIRQWDQDYIGCEESIIEVYTAMEEARRFQCEAVLTDCLNHLS